MLQGAERMFEEDIVMLFGAGYVAGETCRTKRDVRTSEVSQIA